MMHSWTAFKVWMENFLLAHSEKNLTTDRNLGGYKLISSSGEQKISTVHTGADGDCQNNIQKKLLEFRACENNLAIN